MRGRSSPAIIAATHGFATDQTGLVTGFAENPTNSLLYVQYALQQRAFLDIVKETGHGVFCSTTIGTLQDEIGNTFSRKIRGRFGEDATPSVAGQVYDSYFLWAIAACRAGGTGVPYDGIEQNKKVCHFLREIDLSRRGRDHQVHVGPGGAAVSGGDQRSFARYAHDHDAVSGLDQGCGLRRAVSV